MKKTFAIAIAALLAGSLTGMARATAVREVRQQVVSYADLNLESEADAAILLSRIESAARRLCSVGISPMPLELQRHLRMCVEDATARAVADVNAPPLTRRGQIVVRNTIE
jgi:UrcA family protein